MILFSDDMYMCVTMKPGGCQLRAGAHLVL